MQFVKIVLGAALVAAGVALELVFPALTPLAMMMISAGVGMVISGIGTLLSGHPLGGVATATRDPIAPRNVILGRQRVGGICVYVSEFGDNNKYLDMVLVLACHPCLSVDELMFDGQRVQIDATDGMSFTPVQQSVNISHISRTNNVVTAILEANIPLLSDGDNLIIQNITGDYTLNGTYPVTIVSRVVGGPGSITVSYLSGGAPSIVDNEGEALTTWPDYGSHVFMEVCLGTQTTAFPGMLYGTPDPADPHGPPVITPQSFGFANPWNASCILNGMTAVHLRLNYDDSVFANGLPTIAFLIHGKCDIYDPRTSPPTIGYTENAALLIADYLCNTEWGFRAVMGVDVPLPQLIAAANVCDEAIPLAAGGTEPAYSCNGAFPLSMKRGEVLQNLLTSCAGRITYNGGQFVIQPAAWIGVSLDIHLDIPPSWVP